MIPIDKKFLPKGLRHELEMQVRSRREKPRKKHVAKGGIPHLPDCYVPLSPIPTEGLKRVKCRNGCRNGLTKFIQVTCDDCGGKLEYA